MSSCLFPPHPFIKIQGDWDLSTTSLSQRDKCHPREEGFIKNSCQHRAQTFVFKSGSTVVTMSHNKSFASIKPGDQCSGNHLVLAGRKIPNFAWWPILAQQWEGKMALESSSTTAPHPQHSLRALSGFKLYLNPKNEGLGDV